MAATPKRPASGRPGRPRNEAIGQYEMGIDDLFEREKRIRTDSSLGPLPPEGAGRK